MAQRLWPNDLSEGGSRVGPVSVQGRTRQAEAGVCRLVKMKCLLPHRSSQKARQIDGSFRVADRRHVYTNIRFRG